MYPRERFVGTAIALVLGLAMITGLMAVPHSGSAMPPEDAWITGVVDDGLDPVEDVYVKVLLFTPVGSPLEMGSTFTDVNGEYTIGVIGGFEYMVLAANGSYRMSFTAVKVDSGETVQVDFTLESIAPEVADVTIKGWVKDEMGAPSSDGYVLGLSNDPGGDDIPFYANFTKPGVDGYFEVNVIESLTGGGAIAMDFPGYSMIENGTDAPLVSGMTYWFNITLTDNSEFDVAMIFGYVTDQDTGLPIEGAMVSVGIWNNEMSYSYSNLTFSDSDGYYEMYVSNGSARIMVMKEGYSIEMYNDETIEEGDMLQFDADLRPLDCVVRGTVIDMKSTDPLPMARVILFDADFNIAMATTDSSGEYYLDAFSGTELVMLATMEGYADEVVLIDLSPGEEAWQDFGLWPPSAVLEGTVRDAVTGDPVEGAWAWASSDIYDEGAETDGSGFYSMDLVPGTYEVGIGADGYMYYMASGVELVDEETTVLDVLLFPSDMPLDTMVYGWVNGSVSTVGIQGATVTIGLPEINMRWGASTNETGYYQFQVPSVEQLTYMVTAWSHAPEIGMIDVFETAEYRMDVMLVPDSSYPDITYLQAPLANVSWTNPCAIDAVVTEENLRDMVMFQFKFWYNEDGYDYYYAVGGNSVSFDPFEQSSGLPYSQLGDTYEVHETFDGTVNGGWLEDGAVSWYLYAHEVFAYPDVYYALRGAYSNATLTNEQGTAFFDSDTGVFIAFMSDDYGKPLSESDDPGALFNPTVMQMTSDEEYAYSWYIVGNMGLGDMSVASLVFSFDEHVPSGDYLTLFWARDFGYLTTPILTRFTVDNDPPVADAGPDQSVVVDTVCTIDGSGSSDNVGILTYLWEFTDDGAPVEAHDESFDYTFTVVGEYEVTLTVVDGAGHEDSDTATITVLADAPPVADAGPDQEVGEGATVEFDGSGSTDDLLVITNYTWTIVELDVNMYGEAPTYTFAEIGVYTVELVVRDSIDQESEPDSMVVTVQDVTPPVADAGEDPVGVFEEDEVVFNGSGSSDNIGIVDYRWTFDDGGPVTLTGVVTEYIFMDAGEYEVTLTVTDAAGLTDTDTVVVRVASRNVAPVADAGDDMQAKAGDPVVFDGSASSDDAVTFTWTFEYDGEVVTLTGVQAEFVFEIPGTYIVTLNVTDEEGLWDTDDVVVIVEDKTTTFLKDYWWLLAAVAAIAVIVALLVLMKGGKGGKPSSSEPDADEVPEEEDLPPPDDEDL